MVYENYHTESIIVKVSRHEEEIITEIAEMLFHQRIEHGDYGGIDSKLSWKDDRKRAEQYLNLRKRHETDRKLADQVYNNC